jgi:pentatricopeptide repeat protein
MQEIAMIIKDFIFHGFSSIHRCFNFKYCQSIYSLILVDFHFHHRGKAFTSGTVTEKEPTLYQQQHCKTQEVSNGREFALMDYGVFASLLQECTNFKSVKQVHAYILTNGLEKDLSLGIKLLNLYTMRGHMENARLIFDRIRIPNSFLWNIMIRGYAKNGPCEEALKLYYRMKQAGVQPDNFTFPFLLKACASLSAVQEGKKVHEDIVGGGFESDVFVGSALIHMYAKCRSLENARQVFDKMCTRDVVSWNAMVAGYAQNGHPETVLRLFDEMRKEDVVPDWFTMVSVIQACTHLGALQQGMWIHDYITRSGFESDVFVGTALIDMYAKCRSIDIVFVVFEKMLKRDVVSWNAMITGYVHNGNANEALMFLRQMQLAALNLTLSPW